MRVSRSSIVDTESQVLVVDKDPSFAKLAARAAAIAFHGVPHRISIATSGDEALDKARVRVPELVLLDYDMPDMDGLEVLTRLRSMHRGGEARVVVVSAVAPGERWKFASLGVEDFLAKPVGMPALLKMLEA